LAYLKAQPDLSALLIAADGRPIICGSFEKKAYVYSHRFSETFVTLV
jgi:hypothetical protein